MTWVDDARRDLVAWDSFAEGAHLAGMAAAEDRARLAGTWRTSQTSLMEVLGTTRDEIANCKVLAWALDPVARHGIGASVIGELVEGLDLKVSTERLWTAVVRTEVIRQTSRADVVVARPGIDDWTIVIEAKIDAREGPTQCRHLEQDWPAPHHRLLFLTRNGQRPSTACDPDRWTPVTWSMILDIVIDKLADAGRQMAGDASTAEARDALKSWATSASRSLR